MNNKSNYKKYGWIWIILSPILWIMSAISSIQSITTYYVQLTCFSIVAILGLVSGIATLFQVKWAPNILKYLSWLGFIYFSGAGVAMIAYYTVFAIIEAKYKTAAILLPVSLGAVATGLPFYFMAKNIRTKNNT
jgi:hypothetical protein